MIVEREHPYFCLNLLRTIFLSGADISKPPYTVFFYIITCAVNYRGIEVGKTISFANDQVGYEKLMRWVSQMQKVHELTQVIFGMESTGHYGMPLAQWLHDHNYDVVQVNPLTTKRNKEDRDNRPSNFCARWFRL
ncbi:IS110 family transposase [Paenibacillus elgii]|uniref:IS110 family transposase n=1 Tax=Paenibacillus elgii TaxID=189691 RepID=UPI001ED904EA|nr:IS110 family transposase [Paenibacillus elgii]